MLSQRNTKLKFNKTPPQDDIPVKILTLNQGIISHQLSKMLNRNRERAYFPKELKFADSTTVYKKRRPEQ